MKNVMILLLVMLASQSYAVFVHGHLAQETIWSPENNPYIVDGFIYVDSGVTLTIQPGVQVLVQAADANENWNGFRWNGSNEPQAKMFYVNGRIVAIGSEAQPIIFDRYQDHPTYR